MFDVLMWRRVEEYIPLKKRRQLEGERRGHLRRKLQVDDMKKMSSYSDLRVFARHVGHVKGGLLIAVIP